MDRGKFKPKFNRIIFIDKKIREGSYPNARTLAEEYEGVSPRTIKRDIEWLRDFHEAPIEYSFQNKGYYYSEGSFSLPALRISESELFSMAIAEQALAQYRNTPIYDSLCQIFEKIKDLLPEKATIESNTMNSRFTIFEQASAMINRSVWNTAMQGLEENRVILFDYTAPGYKKSVRRTFQPYHAICHKSQWYLIGLEEVKQDIRIFALSRMNNLILTNRVFSVPVGFAIEDFVDHNFGIFINQQNYIVRLRVAAEVHTFFTERIWHEKQELTEQTDGSLLLSFPTNQLEEVMFWVMSWGEHVVVEEPKELVDMVRTRLELSLDNYKKE
ncbi:MAG: WYL domain-containing protein [Spirochaetales bacterium]|nr:WYL domain-containing protein [Spirochaetales bacterium]